MIDLTLISRVHADIQQTAKHFAIITALHVDKDRIIKGQDLLYEAVPCENGNWELGWLKYISL